ncbi:hypothetical protein CKO15_04640 [Halorhodospira abdelmalekii]|nr:hypothetical protein [Halorhodospira abdelmalekii]
MTTGAALASPLPPHTQVFEPGVFEAQLFTGVRNYSSDHGTTADFMPRLRAGAPGPFDLALGIPYRYDSKSKDSALRSDLHLDLSYQWLDRGATQSVIRFHTMVGANSELEGVGSGRTNLGVAVDWRRDGIYAGNDLYLRGAWEHIDQRRPDEDAGPGSYRAVGLLTLEAAMDINVEGDFTPYFGLRATVGASGNRRSEQQSLSLRPGFHWKIAEGRSLFLVSQFDMAERGGEPERAVFVTYSYNFETGWGDAAASRGVEQVTARMARLERQVDALGRSVHNLERRWLLGTPSGDPVASPETEVLLLNQSGIAELKSSVGRLLDPLEVRLVDMRQDPDAPTRDRTVIRHAHGLTDKAVEIARALPGHQLIEESNEIPDGADIVVLIGFDLETALD